MSTNKTTSTGLVPSMYGMSANAKTVTMSSIEIADLTEKNHAHIMRDIREIVEKLNESKIGFMCTPSAYTGKDGRKYDCYLLDREATEILLTGYDVVRRAKVIKRWRELETGAYGKPIIPPTSIDLAKAVADYAIERCHVCPEMALAMVAESAVQLGAPETVKMIVPALPQDKTGFLTPTAIAIKLGWYTAVGKSNPRRVNAGLRDLGLQYKDGKNEWHLTDKGKGLGECKPYQRGSHAGYQILWRESVVSMLGGVK